MFAPLRRFFSARQHRKYRKSHATIDSTSPTLQRQGEKQETNTKDFSSPRPKTIQPKNGVKVEPAPHHANPIILDRGRGRGALTEVKHLMEATCEQEFKNVKNGSIIQSSFEDDISQKSPALTARNGFVDSVVLAYNRHHHLVIRPEDIWFSILSQLNLYINANSEKLRHMFVAHEGKKALKLVVGEDPMVPRKDTMFGIDWASFGYLMGKKLAENILDPTLRDWFMPAFSTTTKVDQATASIMLMSSMQKYFEYYCVMCCGLPSVTLLGQKKDWEKMLSRLERLKTFGDEPKVFYTLLDPVLQKLVGTFDNPDSEEIRDFWQHIAHYSGGGSGPTYLSGWITAFCFWDADGKCFHDPEHDNPPSKEEEAKHSYRYRGEDQVMVLDNARYHIVDTDSIPPGFATVPIILVEDGHITYAQMVAGSMGMMLSSSGLDPANVKEGEYDTIQPGSGWSMWETHAPDE